MRENIRTGLALMSLNAHCSQMVKCKLNFIGVHPNPHKKHVGDAHYAPNFEKVGSILLSACPFVRLSVRSKEI